MRLSSRAPGARGPLFFENSPFYRPPACAYAVARRLGGSREIGGLAAIFAAYQTNFGRLYFDTGFIYDVLFRFHIVNRQETYRFMKPSGGK